MITEVKDRINIKEFVLSKSSNETKNGFNPKRDIFPYELDAFNEFTRSQLGADYFIYKGILSYFSSEENNDIPPLNQNRIEQLIHDFIDFGKPSTASAYLERIFFGKKFYKDIEFNEKFLNHSKRLLLDSSDHLDFYRNYFYTQFINPDIKKDVTAPSNIQSEMIFELDTARNQQSWYEVVQYTAWAKSIKPDIFNENRITDDEWLCMKSAFHKFTDEKYYSEAISMAFYMHVLTADRIKETKAGPVFMPKNTEIVFDQTDNTPVRRKF
jgi:hypothetical protein